MKLKSPVILGLLMLTGCAVQPNVFTIGNFYPLGEGCVSDDTRDTVISPNGYLDVAAGDPVYFIGMQISGAERIAQEPVISGEVVQEQEIRNRPIITRQIINYRLSKRIGATPRPYEFAMYMPFDDNGEVFGAIQLISPELGQALFDNLTPSENIADDFVDITVELQFQGVFSADGHPFSTGVASYPIRAYRSMAPTCPAGVPYARFPYADGNGVPDRCRYVGASQYQVFQPAKPQCCSTMIPGC